MTKLKACPFCGCAAKELQQDDGGDIVHAVRCTNASCIGNDIQPRYFDAEQARKVWNRRADNGKQ